MAADLEYLSEMERYNNAIGSHTRAGKIRDAIAEISANRAAQVGANVGVGKSERLTAAAPDLLEALKGVVRVADRATVEFDAARAAIAKAEGREAEMQSRRMARDLANWEI